MDSVFRICTYLTLIVYLPFLYASEDAKRLYDDLLSPYNKLIRPVINESEPVTIKMKLKLSQLIEVNLKNQIMTTNLWVEQYWTDHKLRWDPRNYSGVHELHVPADFIWRPDIVLYNNADGNFEVTLATKAQLHHTGIIQWRPPAVYKSSCAIDVEFFPFDEQTCVMKFGSWTYDGFKVDLHHVDEMDNTSVIDIGMDLSEFYMSVEWDILKVPAKRNVKIYNCCEEPYVDITFNISMRRKTLFYTVNLIIPCMGITSLTVLVFYLPSDSGEKVALSISILLSLTVFILLLAEIIPPTSLVVPLLGKYLMFTMTLVTLSIAVTIVVLNVHFRSGATHPMAPWIKKWFLNILPRLLFMYRATPAPDSRRVASRPRSDHRTYPDRSEITVSPPGCSTLTVDVDWLRYSQDLPSIPTPPPPPLVTQPRVVHPRVALAPHIQRALDAVEVLADHTRQQIHDEELKDDWKYVAMVMDRLFLWIFTIAVFCGSAFILLQAPTLYDTRIPIDAEVASHRHLIEKKIVE